MTPRKLPEGAQDYYFELGPTRTYQAVASHFGVSKRTVARRAKDEGWQQRINSMCRLAVGEAENLLKNARSSDIQEAIEETVTPKRLRLIMAMLMTAAVKDNNVRAAQIILDRVLGKPRPPLPITNGARSPEWADDYERCPHRGECDPSEDLRRHLVA